jgi:hypothetical protein
MTTSWQIFQTLKIVLVWFQQQLYSHQHTQGSRLLANSNNTAPSIGTIAR